MACITAILTLITRGFKEEFAAEGALHYLIKLPRDKLVAIHLVDLAFAHPHSALTPETPGIQRPPSNIFLD